MANFEHFCYKFSSFIMLLLTDSSRGLSQKIREIFAKNLQKICEIFAKNLRKIREKLKFAKYLRKSPEKFANVNFSRIFCKFFANISRIFRKYFTNISQIFRKFFANFLRIFRKFFVTDHVKSPLGTQKKVYLQSKDISM